jgi:hypothetical protein
MTEIVKAYIWGQIRNDWSRIYVSYNHITQECGCMLLHV